MDSTLNCCFFPKRAMVASSLGLLDVDGLASRVDKMTCSSIPIVDSSYQKVALEFPPQPADHSTKIFPPDSLITFIPSWVAEKSTFFAAGAQMPIESQTHQPACQPYVITFEQDISREVHFLVKTTNQCHGPSAGAYPTGRHAYGDTSPTYALQ